MRSPWLIGIASVLLAAGLAAAQDEWQGTGSPFSRGEAQPDITATCETAEHWIAKAPTVDGRISFAIEGKLVAVHWDGALAYLIMCDPAGVQVMCVTYSKDGRGVGENVTFAGGYARAGERRILLDPCLASEE